MPNPDKMLESARRVIQMEAAAVAALENRLGEPFIEAVGAILRASGRVIVSGVGKSGIIGRKIAATLTSTGSPAIFLHPVDALHGDLGIVGPEDVALLLSKSGESEELRGTPVGLGAPRTHHRSFDRQYGIRSRTAGPDRARLHCG